MQRSIRALCAQATQPQAKYGKVFEPIVLNCGLELKNRVVMGSASLVLLAAAGAAAALV